MYNYFSVSVYNYFSVSVYNYFSVSVDLGLEDTDVRVIISKIDGAVKCFCFFECDRRRSEDQGFLVHH